MDKERHRDSKKNKGNGAVAMNPVMCCGQMMQITREFNGLAETICSRCKDVIYINIFRDVLSQNLLKRVRKK